MALTCALWLVLRKWPFVLLVSSLEIIFWYIRPLKQSRMHFISGVPVRIGTRTTTVLKTLYINKYKFMLIYSVFFIWGTLCIYMPDKRWLYYGLPWLVYVLRMGWKWDSFIHDSRIYYASNTIFTKYEQPSNVSCFGINHYHSGDYFQINLSKIVAAKGEY